MLKMGLVSLFWTFSQSITIIIVYQFYFRYALTHGGIGGTMLDNIHPIVWVIIILEYIISIGLIYIGVKGKN
jgi:hypothetical protein